MKIWQDPNLVPVHFSVSGFCLVSIGHEIGCAPRSDRKSPVHSEYDRYRCHRDKTFSIIKNAVFENYGIRLLKTKFQNSNF